MYGRRLPLVGRCAVGGAVGFVAAVVAAPVVLGLALAGTEDFPSSALFVGATSRVVLSVDHTKPPAEPPAQR